MVLKRTAVVSVMNFLIDGTFKAPLSQEIQRAYNKLVNALAQVFAADRMRKCIEGTGGQVSPTDLVAYQIGWGKLLISWYKAGLLGQQPIMPGEGFTGWDYTAIAKHFYQKYTYDQNHQQMDEFKRVVHDILEITEQEHRTGRLDQVGVWAWCTLQSGKAWPLSKWIKVNSSSPYKRALLLLKQHTPTKPTD